MSFAVDPHRPIVAFGITAEVTLDSTPAEGSTVMTFDNDPEVIAVGEPVWIRSADESVLQYRGLCTVSGAAQITVQIPLQDAVGASATAWVPTDFVHFTAENPDTQRPIRDTGTTTVRTSGAIPLNYNAADPQDSVDLSFSIRLSDDYENWLTFVDTDRNNRTLRFNVAYYDFAKRLSKTPKVVAAGETASMQMVNVHVNSFTQRFWIVEDGVYVES